MTEIYRRAALCRAFENEVYRRVESRQIKCPVYLSAGQELIAATLSVLFESYKPVVFVQHRNHSQYLCFGGSMEHLIAELTGGDTGMQGSASIGEGDIFGHDGFMGSQVPIAAGYCYATKRPTICFMGDAAVEEDYVLAAFGMSATLNLPILFVVEDNNLAILTTKKVRRTWDVVEVAKGFGLRAMELSDSPQYLEALAAPIWKDLPALINVTTTRKYWHAGAGCDDLEAFDRLAAERIKIENSDAIDAEVGEIVRKTWERCATQSAN